MSGDPEALRRSVVKLFTVVKEPDYYRPWELGHQYTSGGSACVVEGQRILTNAHVVAHHIFVQALKPGDTKKYTARVLHVDHDTETALLGVDDPAFWEGTVPVRLGQLPPRNAQIAVYGFPVGGNELCITAGVVSRIEVRTYTHSQRNLLALQTDAAINPGNSGGPVFMDGELIGIAFQSYRRKDLQKAGYVVPIPVIRHLFEDLEDGAISGVPDLGIYSQKIENDALRAHLGLSPDHSGVRVSRVVPGSSADGVLQVDDVVMSVDGTAVACDGTVPLRDHDRVQFEHLISRRQVGDRVDMAVLRGGAALRVTVQLARYVSLVPLPEPDRRPSYFIFAGLMFTPLTHAYMEHWEWAREHFRYQMLYHATLPSPERRQIVLLHEVLAHPINLGYHQMRGAVVDRINGVAIGDMRDVVRAFAEPMAGLHVVETDYYGPRSESKRSDFHHSFGTHIVIDASSAARATAEVLAQHRIPSDRSDDLR